jgi:uncharacterized protein YmfQ (DUF2313 family)
MEWERCSNEEAKKELAELTYSWERLCCICGKTIQQISSGYIKNDQVRSKVEFKGGRSIQLKDEIHNIVLMCNDCADKIYK